MTRNTALIEACAGVLGNPQPHLASISIEFVSNTDGASYSFKPFTIQELQFDFNFTGDVFTSILTAIKVSGYDYGLLQDQTQNILATVVITPRNIDGSRVTTVTPYLQQFHVMLVNAADSRITASDLHLHVEPTKDILIRLVDPLAYRLRHEAVNCILRKATVSDMIHYLAHCHDVTNIDVIEPDNTYRWDHLILPSYPNFTAGLGYLQSQYGVYAKGCNYYIHNDRLYVYPPFETSPDSQGTLTFYQSRQGQATMGGSKHSKAGNDYRIIVDQPAATTDLSVAGAENHGTAISFTRAARSQDGMSYNDPHTGVGFTEDNSVIMSAVDPQTLDSTRNKIKQIRSTSNPFPNLSLMAAHRCAMMTAHWDGADINAIVPGKKVIYCYDENGFLSQRNGILERAHFIYRRQQRAGSVDMFSIDADLAIRLEPSSRKTY